MKNAIIRNLEKEFFSVKNYFPIIYSSIENDYANLTDKHVVDLCNNTNLYDMLQYKFMFLYFLSSKINKNSNYIKIVDAYNSKITTEDYPNKPYLDFENGLVYDFDWDYLDSVEGIDCDVQDCVYQIIDLYKLDNSSDINNQMLKIKTKIDDIVNLVDQKENKLTSTMYMEIIFLKSLSDNIRVYIESNDFNIKSYI